jgi:hypothetical protein
MKMHIKDLSPMAMAILDNIDVESHYLRMELESKVSSSKDENTFLQNVIIHIGCIMDKPGDYLKEANIDGKIDLQYFQIFMKHSKTSIQQILSIPVTMRFWMKKEDVD